MKKKIKDFTHRYSTGCFKYRHGTTFNIQHLEKTVK